MTELSLAQKITNLQTKVTTLKNQAAALGTPPNIVDPRTNKTIPIFSLALLTEVLSDAQDVLSNISVLKDNLATLQTTVQTILNSHAAVTEPPESATSTGDPGNFYVAADAVFLCIATNTWVKLSKLEF